MRDGQLRASPIYKVNYDFGVFVLGRAFLLLLVCSLSSCIVMRAVD